MYFSTQFQVLFLTSMAGLVSAAPVAKPTVEEMQLAHSDPVEFALIHSPAQAARCFAFAHTPTGQNPGGCGKSGQAQTQASGTAGTSGSGGGSGGLLGGLFSRFSGGGGRGGGSGTGGGLGSIFSSLFSKRDVISNTPPTDQSVAAAEAYSTMTSAMMKHFGF